MRDVKAPSQFFWDKNTKSFKEDLKFVAEERGGSVSLYVPPLQNGLNSVLTKSELTQFWWTAQHVCKDMMDRGSKSDMERFIAEVRRHGICETLLNKFKWHDMVYDEQRQLSLHKSAIEFVASALGETIPPVTMQALQLWNSYDGPASEYPAHSSDTALLASSFGVTGGRVSGGMQLLLDKGFFVRREFKGITYYKTPEVEKAEQALCAALAEICSRPLIGASAFAPDSTSTHDAGQLAALQMMFEHHVSIVTGLAGTGKSETTSTFLSMCASAGVIAPSHAAKKVIQDKCRRAGCAAIGFEVVQFTKLLGKCRSSDRSVAFLESMGWTQEGDEGEGKDRVPDSISAIAHAIVFEETGMQDLQAVAQTLKVVADLFPDLCRVVFCGDPNQLRSIDRGNVLQDLIDGGVPHVQLMHNWRSGQALACNFRCIVEQRPTDLTYDDTFQVIECAAADMVPLAQRKGEASAPKSLPLAKIVAEFIADSDRGEQPHIVAYMNIEVNAINDAVIDALGLRSRKGEPFLVRDLKVVVTDSVHVPASANTGSLTLTKASMYVVTDITRAHPRSDSLPVLPKPDATAGEVGEIDESLDYFKVTLQVWRGEETISFFAAHDDISKHFEVGYATTIHKMQGGESQFLYCIAIPNCAFYDCYSLYTNTSRARERCKCFARPGDLTRIIKKRTRGRISTLQYLIHAMSAQF
ncbi:P-loop containing nucleoside triphosphate hydrolase protein [Tribonema minus]|uniref:P-loop containing nucleoside triphosphate hydrolase protein n=1 Tax=Tribonema minus TaxID=303371 RepID=A0A835Z6C2_9STRA|nr:P-loop containing nucleoside triphosphate hydrolase protein [Tribonema minus]